MAATISHPPRRPPPLTSSNPSTSTLPHSNRNRDSFRPKLPSDPFSNNAFPQQDPIILNVERLFHIASTSQPRRDAILVLGGQYLSVPTIPPLLNETARLPRSI